MTIRPFALILLSAWIVRDLLIFLILPFSSRMCTVSNCWPIRICADSISVDSVDFPWFAQMSRER